MSKKIFQVFQALILITLLTWQSQAQNSNDLNEDRFHGAVSSVRVSRKFTREAGSIILTNSPLLLANEDFYNSFGMRIKCFQYDDKGEFLGEINYQFEVEPIRRSGGTVHDSTGRLIRRVEYKYKENGKFASITNYDYELDGRVIKKLFILNEYEETGRTLITDIDDKPLASNEYISRPLFIEDTLLPEKNCRRDDVPVTRRHFTTAHIVTLDGFGNLIQSVATWKGKDEQGIEITETSIRKQKITYYR
jgi:hypothetical protein